MFLSVYSNRFLRNHPGININFPILLFYFLYSNYGDIKKKT